MELATKQGFKQTEVGLIPEDWNEIKLGKNAMMFSGGTPNTAVKEYYKGNIPWISSSELNQKNIYSTNRFISENGLNNSSAKLVFENTFLLAMYGATAGICAITKIKGAINQAVLAIESERITSSYLYHFFSLKKEEIILKYCQGGQPNLSGSIVKSIKIPLPPTLKEQKAIATALSDMDDLIASLEDLIAKKQAIKQGAMQQLLTPPHKGGKRLPGFSGDWVEKKLGNLGDCIIGLTYKPSNVANSGTLVLRSSNIQNDQLAFDDNVYVQMDIPDKLRTQMDDLLICVRNGSRSLIGKCARIDGRCVNQSFGAFMSIYRSPYNKFITHVFKSYSIQKQIEKNLGATINQITNKVLNSFKIWFPVDEKERNQVSIFLDDMDKEIEQLETKKAKYQQLKQGMLQELLTGNTRLV
ncbi:Type I restriction-modification enzyme S subunit, HsdS family [Tenacibaculum maritimum]|uniref:restriction endonuclease subunit S n=1 Tax=Tenacibaculum maritimum TaxID=107401 RepID=UPI0012E66C10|nr:restriction endonuclease subunit S [Tenacibaculum maritimum]CAA0156357.1 Type I restriction-modification enzyme S subunit, HsdS family [Tenacibaculum maritimum]